MRAIITGVIGQTGSYLAEHLIEQNYDVYGVYRRISSGDNLSNISTIKDHPRFHLIAADICDYSLTSQLIGDIKPDEMYNLAAMSHVAQSFKEPIQTFRVNAEAVLGELEAIRKYSPTTKFLQAGTSELYGKNNCPATGFNEQSLFSPCSPYAVAKLAAHHAVKNYRDAYKLFASNFIGFNHESPRRGSDFVTKKITRGVAAVKLGLQEHVLLGNIDAKRDWGHAQDYCVAQHLILQQDKPDDFVVATGQTISVRDALEFVCKLAGLDFQKVYKQDERFMRPSDVPYLLGDASKAKQVLGWKPKYDWKSLLTEMYQYDWEELYLETLPK